MENLGRKKAKSSSSRPPSFFKVYLPEQNLYKLLIPREYVKYFKGDIPNKVHLKNDCGSVWTADLEVLGNRTVYITQGWEQYAADHLLVRGDFLVFEQEERSVFYIRVFSINGCIKEEPTYERLSSEGLAASSVAAAAAADAANLRFTKTFAKNYTNCVGVPKHVLDQCDYTVPQHVILRNQADKGHYTSTQLRKTDRVVLGFKGLANFWKQAGAMVGDQLEFEVILGRGRKIREFRVKITSNSKA